MAPSDDPTLLYGIGATKAGTSWLYRTLANREDCALSAVKETHYWDTFDLDRCDKQIGALTRQRIEFEEAARAADVAGQGWKARNMARRIASITRLIDMLARPRDDHGAYVAYLMAEAGPRTRLIADICPSYALLPAARYAQMAKLDENARFLYLMRDPLARLWSAVRMQAKRQRQQGEDLAEKANNTLWRILHKGAETHVTQRGDYGAVLKKLSETVPPEQRAFLFMEELLSDDGYGDLCRFLGLPLAPAPVEERVHAGAEIAMRPHLLRDAKAFLAPQYEAVARHMGRLPAAWEAGI
ncbi:MAG: sulfotransferase [Pseudomonadota bacterium]